MRVEKAAGVELPGRNVLKFVQEVPTVLPGRIREQLGMDFPDEPQVFQRQVLQPVVVEVDMDDSFQRHARIDERSHPLIGDVGFPRATHSRHDRGDIALFRDLDIAGLDIRRNAELVELAHDLSKDGFHACGFYRVSVAESSIVACSSVQK